MAKGYVLLLLDVKDPRGYGKYAEAAAPTVMKYEGRPVVMSSIDHVLEGKAPSSRVVLLEFESVKAARAWYTDPEYRKLIPERLEVAVGPVVLLEGWTPPARGDGDDRVTATRVDDYTELDGAALFDTPFLTGATGGTAGSVTITGTPPNACGAAGAPSGNASNPGNDDCWYSGADQSPPMPTQLLELSESVSTFGVSFVHYSQAGVNATAPARVRVYGQPGGAGPLLGEALSSGGTGLVDFVALQVEGASIHSAVIDCPDQTAFAVTAYAVVV